MLEIENNVSVSLCLFMPLTVVKMSGSVDTKSKKRKVIQREGAAKVAGSHEAGVCFLHPLSVVRVNAKTPIRNQHKLGFLRSLQLFVAPQELICILI